MRRSKNPSILRTLPLLIAACFFSIPAYGQYGGGMGTAEDLHQMWMAEQMNAIGAEPDDWDRHLKLTARALRAYYASAVDLR
jgi:hypothetical protein